MQEMNVALGQEVQVSVNPVIQTTSDIARTRFSPAQRGCYFQVGSGGGRKIFKKYCQGELSLPYLNISHYRYNLGNCLFIATYQEVLRQCKCIPGFHQVGSYGAFYQCQDLTILMSGKILAEWIKCTNFTKTFAHFKI